MTVRGAKMALSIGWLLAVAPLIIVLVLRQLGGYYGANPKEVWNWFTQFVLPALTLLAGAWTVTTAPGDKSRFDNSFVFWLAAALSAFYVALLYFVIGMQTWSQLPWQEVFKQSALFLGILQGLVIGVVGKFFIESGR
jgi:hypothetical protein